MALFNSTPNFLQMLKYGNSKLKGSKYYLSILIILSLSSSYLLNNLPPYSTLKIPLLLLPFLSLPFVLVVCSPLLSSCCIYYQMSTGIPPTLISNEDSYEQYIFMPEVLFDSKPNSHTLVFSSFSSTIIKIPPKENGKEKRHGQMVFQINS